MGKFKKNFWRERTVTTEEGKQVDIPEPEWFSRQYDPTDRLGGYKGLDNPRPEGALIPRALVNGVETPIKEAYAIYKANCVESFTLKFPHFKTALINGTKFKTSKGLISKP